MKPTEHSFSCPNPKGLFKRGFGMHNMHYVEWGDPTNEKVVICVHGFTRNARDFDYLACALVDAGFRVICPDIVGRGKSDWLSHKKWYGYPLYVADILAFIGQLKLTSVHWVGTSMGGLIGIMLEAGTPYIIDKMVINDIGPFIPKKSLQRIGSYVGQDPVFDTQEEATVHLKKIMNTFGIKNPAHWDHIVAHGFTQKEDGKWYASYDPAISHVFRKRSGKQKKLPDINLWSIWKHIHCPMLILRGTESDVLSAETARKMMEKDKAKLIEFEGIGHAPTLMEEDQIALVWNWLVE